MKSWSGMAVARKEIRRRFRRIWDVPLRTSKTGTVQISLQHKTTPLKVLDIGGSDGKFADKILANFPGSTKIILDVDPHQAADYRSIDEIHETFDAIFLFEIIEHISPETADLILSRLPELIGPDGLLFISTPNIYNPTLFLCDPTHIHYLSYDNLGGLLIQHGFKVLEIFRIYDAAPLKRWIRRLFLPLFKIMNLDYASTILVIASKY
jgi:SAM-dependent methyltransferase